MTFAQHVLDYQFSLREPFPLMNDIEWLMPYEDEETRRVMALFYCRFYGDENKRTFILGINPGRFGAGITGIPFTDPVRLEKLGIENIFPKRQELSSVFIYEMIDRCGGPEKFYSQFYFSSLSPLGFVKHGKNYNYYDDRQLADNVKDYIIQNIESQLKFRADRSVVYCLGQGKNYTYLENLNTQYKWWEKVVALPHPRWIMQYKLKRKEEFITQYQTLLLSAGRD